MIVRRRDLRATVAALLIGLTGCYSYVPLGTSRPERGAEIRARLSRPADLTLTEVTVNDVVALDAEVVRSGEDSLVVSAMSLRSQSGAAFSAAGESVSIPATSIESLEAKRFSVVRSSVLIVAASAAASLLFAALGTLESGGSGGKPGPQPK